jgi:hypothetical protein
MIMPGRMKRIFDYYRHRRSCPEIEHAFRDYSPENEQIRNQPSFEQLKDALCKRLSGEGYEGVFDTAFHLKSVKGVTIEFSVTLLGDSDIPIGTAIWKAGEGTSIIIHRPLN